LALCGLGARFLIFFHALCPCFSGVVTLGGIVTGALRTAPSRIPALGGFGARGLIFLHTFGPRFSGVFAAGRAVSVLCVTGNDAHSGGQYDEAKFAQFHNLTVFLWF
jgi:hypothetical protein